MPDGLLAAARGGACVGRRRELKQLVRDLDAVRFGERRVVLLTGEPGIGKTRLAAEAGLAAHARGALVLYGRTDEGLASPYQAFAEALGHLVSNAPAAVLESAGPALGKLASLVPAARERGAAAAPKDGHGGERYVLFGAVGSLLSAASARQPVVLVLDDLHWADVPTVLLLNHLLAIPGRPRVMVIATCRPVEPSQGTELFASLAQLRRDERVAELELEGLSEGDVLDLVEELAGAELEEGERVYARALHRETDGNPLFVSEVIRGLGGRDEIAAAAAALERGGGSAALAAPASLRELIVARAAALGPETLAVLEAAAVVGREFDTGLLARVAELDAARVEDVLDGAERAALIVPVAGGPGRFAFHHLLIGHTLYEHIGAARRARLHRRVAEALEELAREPAGAAAGEIARHWAEANPPDRERALRYAELAGRHALREIDPDAAVRWLGEALGLHGTAQDRRRCSLLIALGVAQRKHGDARYRETLLEAARLGRRLGEPKLLVRAAIENTRGFVSDAGQVDTERVAMLEAALEAVGDFDSRERAVLLGMLAFELSFEHDRERRVALADEALAVARRLDDPRILCYVLGARSMPIWAPETLDERLACTAESVRLADGLGDPLARFHALHWRGVALVEAGEMDEVAARGAARTGPRGAAGGAFGALARALRRGHGGDDIRPSRGCRAPRGRGARDRHRQRPAGRPVPLREPAHQHPLRAGPARRAAADDRQDGGGEPGHPELPRAAGARLPGGRAADRGRRAARRRAARRAAARHDVARVRGALGPRLRLRRATLAGRRSCTSSSARSPTRSCTPASACGVTSTTRSGGSPRWPGGTTTPRGTSGRRPTATRRSALRSGWRAPRSMRHRCSWRGKDPATGSGPGSCSRTPRPRRAGWVRPGSSAAPRCCSATNGPRG